MTNVTSEVKSMDLLIRTVEHSAGRPVPDPRYILASDHTFDVV